jgi:regulator of sigma E protease
VGAGKSAADFNFMTLTVVLTVLGTFIAAFILFSITVFVHELGHFLAARWQGLLVEEFAIGMGKKVFGFRYNGVDYNLRIFPFGGYVKLPQMSAMEMVEGQSKEDTQSLPPISPLAKILTAFAGPLFSFLLAIAFAFICYWVGVPQNQGSLTRVLGFVEPGTPAERAGLLPGDEFLRVDDRKVSRWQGRYDGVVESLVLSKNEQVKVEVKRGEEVKTFIITPERDPEMENLRMIGIENYPSREAVVGTILSDSPAVAAGLKKGDIISSVNGLEVKSPGQVGYYVAQNQGECRLQVKRGGEVFEVTITPAMEKTTGRRLIGVAWDVSDVEVVHISPYEQIINGVFTIKRTFEALGSSKSGVGFRHLSGPVGIFDKLMNLLTVDWRLVLSFSVVLNVNLAIMNLLPIPILDGGHIVLSVAEWIRRKPAEPKIIEVLHMVSFGLILCFFLYVTYFDLNRSAKRVKNFFEQSKAEPTPAFQFEQTTPEKK